MLTTVLYLVAVILMVLGAFKVGEPKVDLFKLGWAFALAAFAFGAMVH